MEEMSLQAFENNSLIVGDSTCEKCHGTGYVAGSWGTQVLCSCVIERSNKKPETVQILSKDIVKVSQSQYMLAQDLLINHGILTEAEFNLTYSREYALKSITERCQALHLTLSKSQVQDCLDTVDTILAELSLKNLPDRSYAIGMENGIGKTTFASNAIKAAAVNGYKVVPYLDMTSLAEKYIEYMAFLRGLRESTATLEKSDRRRSPRDYSWKDYVDADIVFASLTGGNEDTAWLELDCLLTLLSRRASYRLPTIILMRTPVNYYAQFDKARPYVKELFTLGNNKGTYSVLERHHMFTRES